MQKSLGIKLFALTLLAGLMLSFMARTVEAGRPRGGGDLFPKFKGKIVTGISVGPWTPWRLTSAERICPNGLWSFDYTRWRAITKYFYLGERWLSWGWLDHNIVFYERWKNLMGPYSYTVWQKQMKQVYWFNPLEYDPRWPWAIMQTFYRDSLLWADWTGINGILHPDTQLRVLSHRVFFDEVLYYEAGPGQPDGTDAMVIDLANYPLGEHLIRIEAMWEDGTVTPEFLMIPLTTVNYIYARTAPGPLSVMPGRMNVLSGVIGVNNNLGEDRAIYFEIREKRTTTYVESFFDVFVDMSIPNNGTVVSMGDSFFDVFVYVPPHTPIGETIDVEIVAMSLEGLEGSGGGGGAGGYTGGHTSSVRLQMQVVPPTHTLTVSPPVALAGKDTVVIEGFGYTPSSTVGISSSFFDVFFDYAPTDPTGHFIYNMPLKSNFKPYGEHAFAAIDINDGTSATANLKINGPDIDNNGKVEIKDIAYVAKYFGLVLGLNLPLSLGASAAVVVPVGVLWLRKNKQRQPKTSED